jgi:hypothetical protein
MITNGRKKTVLMALGVLAIFSSGMLLGSKVLAPPEPTTATEEYYMKIQAQKVSTSSKTSKKKKGSASPCVAYYGRRSVIAAALKLVQTDALGTTPGDGCSVFPNYPICIGNQLITPPVPFYYDSGLTNQAGKYQDDGVIVDTNDCVPPTIQNQVGAATACTPNAVIHSTLVLLFNDGSEIFG